VTCCTKRAKHRCCIRVSNTHVLYDAPYAHTNSRARARTPAHTHTHTHIRTVSFSARSLKNRENGQLATQHRYCWQADKHYISWLYAPSVECFSWTVDYLQNIKANVVANRQRQHFEPLVPWTFFVPLVNSRTRSSRFPALKRPIYSTNTKPSCISYTDPLVYVHNFRAFRPLKREALRWGIRNSLTQRLFPEEPDPPRQNSAPAIRTTYHQNIRHTCHSEKNHLLGVFVLEKCNWTR